MKIHTEQIVKVFPVYTGKSPEWFTLETWFDRHYRLWVSRIVDSSDNQVGDVVYSSKKERAIKFAKSDFGVAE
jgi:hypothetical protein